MRKLRKILKSIVNILAFAAAIIFILSLVPRETAAGKLIFGIPYAAYIVDYVKTIEGIIIFAGIPSVIMAIYLSILVTDGFRNSSKHKKMIVRKRNRRRNRYIEESRYSNRRAMI